MQPASKAFAGKRRKSANGTSMRREADMRHPKRW